MSKSKSRIVKIHCAICEHNSEKVVPFGCFIRSKDGRDAPNSMVELARERQSKEDIFIEEIVCEKCGCCRELTFKNA